jgi:hypothetical protein
MPLPFFDAPFPPPRLKIATGIADPVLIRISTATQHILLLAENAAYDRAGLIRLYVVRAVTRPRGWKGLFASAAEPGTHPQINVRRDEKSVLAGIPGLPTVRVSSGHGTFSLTSLSRVQYEALTRATSRRLLQATRRLGRTGPRRSAVGRTLSAIHRLRFAVQRAMLSAAAR